MDDHPKLHRRVKDRCIVDVINTRSIPYPVALAVMREIHDLNCLAQSKRVSLVDGLAVVISGQL